MLLLVVLGRTRRCVLGSIHCLTTVSTKATLPLSLSLSDGVFQNPLGFWLVSKTVVTVLRRIVDQQFIAAGGLEGIICFRESTRLCKATEAGRQAGRQAGRRADRRAGRRAGRRADGYNSSKVGLEQRRGGWPTALVNVRLRSKKKVWLPCLMTSRPRCLLWW